MTKYVELLYVLNVSHVLRIPLDEYEGYSMEKIEQVERANAIDEPSLVLDECKETLVYSSEIFCKVIKVTEE